MDEISVWSSRRKKIMSNDTRGILGEKGPGSKLMNRLIITMLVMLVMSTVTARQARAADSIHAEYFVSLQGDDTNDGSSQAKAFASLQKGVDALKPGDTLTIEPGEYHQHVRRDGLGSAEAETTIRAAIDGTVLLRGDVAAPTFKAAKDRQFIYVTDFNAPKGGVQAVIEQDTRTILEAMPNLAELAYGPGRFYYDQKAGKLYISTSDWEPAESHHYTVAVTPEHGLILINPRRVLIQGIATTGFMASFMQPQIDNASRSTWGIFLNKAKDCVIRNCFAYLNACGIGINSHVDTKLDLGGNLVDDCTAWSNATSFNQGDVGGITIFGADHDEIRNSTSFLNDGYGLNTYGGGKWAQMPENKSRIVGGLAWGNGAADVKIKTGFDDLHTTEHTVAFYPSNDYDPAYCLVGSARIAKGGDFAPSNIALDEEKDLDMEAEFADPFNHDYHLQATSRFRRSGPNGSDRGPFAYQANIYFVSPQGDDKADGLSVKQALQTLPQALGKLKVGDTLYLLSGTYTWPSEMSLRGTADQPIDIRGRGEALATVDGDVLLATSSHVTFQRLLLNGAVSVSQSQEVAFKNCRFTATGLPLEVKKVKGLSVRHCEFIGFTKAAIDLVDSEQIFLTGNVFDNQNGPGIRMDQIQDIRYADYNAYGQGHQAWEVKATARSLKSLAPDYERYASDLAHDGGSTRTMDPKANAVFSAAGPLGRPAGQYRDQAASMTPRLAVKPEVHSVSATTANIEWLTTRPAACEIAWGKTPECKNTQKYIVEYFGTYSLTGLTPGEKYYFRINTITKPPGVLESIGYGEWPSEEAPGMTKSEVLSFTTLKADALPRSLYVATTGDDDNTGASLKEAWRTIDHAATQVNVGDTVNIATGQYEERVRLRATGTVKAPITFQAIQGQKVTLAGADQKLNAAFISSGKSHLRFDSLYFQNYSFWDSIAGAGIISSSGLFKLYAGSDIHITRCFADGRGGYPAHFISIWQVTDALVKNCVSLNNMSGAILIWRSPNLRIENYVSVRPMIASMTVNNTPDQKVIISNSILTDMFAKKAKLNLPFMEVESIESVKFDQVDFLLREFPVDQRNIVALVDHQAHAVIKRLTLPELNKNYGAKALAIDPQFQGDHSESNTTPNLDFNDFFATNPKLVAEGIGLQPEAFETFHFDQTKESARIP